MDTQTSARDGAFTRAGAVAAVALGATLLALFIGVASTSTANPRTSEATQYLADIVDRSSYVTAVEWLIAVSALFLAFTFVGLHRGLARWSRDWMGLALVAGIIAAVLRAVMMASISSALQYVAPAWAAAPDDATRAMLVIDLRTTAWVADALFSMFNVVIAIAFFAASAAMFAEGSRFWRVIAWLTVVSAVGNSVAAFALFVEPLVIVNFLAGVTIMVWAFTAGVGLWRLSGDAQGQTNSDRVESVPSSPAGAE